ncbi:MAG: hypothetical protein JWN35_3068, partial [Frankiales bacterium]|nr:hypothetical protein [Frankiales bacterium]
MRPQSVTAAEGLRQADAAVVKRGGHGDQFLLAHRVDSARSGRSPSRAVEVDPLRRGLEKHVDRRPVGETTTLINPGAHISATEIHGIRARDVRHPPAFGDIAALLFARPLGGGVLHYLAALDLALADRLVTLAEADQLGELAQAMCLGAEELLDLHR